MPEATPHRALRGVTALAALLASSGCLQTLDGGSFLGFGPAEFGIDSRDARGVCIVDVNGDGAQDVLLTRAAGVHLWINQGDGAFSEEGAARGMPDAAEWLGCGSADIDEDGDEDLVITDHDGPTLLLRNRGDGVFEDRTAASGIGESQRQGSVVWADLDVDGSVDLLLTGVFPGETRLYRGRGDGTFEERTEQAGLSNLERSWSAAALDVDNDRIPDLFLTTDVAQPADGSTDDRLLLGGGDFTFLDITLDAQVADATDGMGLAVADVDQDTFVDLFVTNIGPHFLWRNLGGLFLNTTTAARVENGGGRVGWGTFFVDVDEDADLDLFLANGGYYERGTVEPLHEGLLPRNRLFLQTDFGSDFPRFRDQAPELQLGDSESSMGAAYGDLDGDGRVDLIVANQAGDPVTVRRSLGHEIGHDPGALRLRLQGTASTPEALGARLVAETCARSTLHTVGTGPSVFSQGERIVHVPLQGCLDEVRVHVGWPSGRQESFEVDDVARDEVRVLIEGRGEED
jgi:hypothetical protein